MSVSTITTTFRDISLFSQLSEDQLAAIAIGTEIHLQPGEYLVKQGECRKDFYVVLEGQIEWTTHIKQREVHVLSHGKGMFFGHEPILMDIPVPVTGRAVTPMHLYKWENDAFWQLISVCPTITRELLLTVTQRFQTLEERSQQQAKLLSLGTLAAGLAHELNNPASAIQRDSRLAQERFATVSSRAFALAQEQLSPSQIQILTALSEEVKNRKLQPPSLDALAKSDLEEEFISWLDEHDVSDGWDIAPFLVEANLDMNWLNQLNTQFQSTTLEHTLKWLQAEVSGKCFLNGINRSAERISHLVKAIKEYSYMDRAPLQTIDLHEGIESTLTILGHKLKNITIHREYDQSLPKIEAYGSELNQVWTNLIDNAADALEGKGNIWLHTYQEMDRVVVEVTDDGPGIPSEVQLRIFEPFFTTKEVGKGTGLGLDICFHIVTETHHGDLRVESQPGHTCFQVRLPLQLDT